LGGVALVPALVSQPIKNKPVDAIETAKARMIMRFMEILGLK
jgi:hypothetical protein